MQFGVDEAGKGPVLGSMFAAAVRGPPSAVPDDVDDSKRLSPARREELAAAVREASALSVGVAEIPVARIDGDEDMNTLTVAAHAEALAAVAADGDAGVVDAGDVNADRFAARVTERVPASVTVAGEHRADESHALVSAASVVAKVARDAHVADLAADHDGAGPLGSGYPSDQTTRSFLRRYVAARGELPACARASWQTSKDVLAAAEQADLGRF